MGSNIYQEAIAEAKKLREVAEQNAKNKIIEAVTPRIRRLIEAELSEGEDFADEELEDVADDIDLEGLDDFSDPSPMPSAAPAPAAALPVEDEIVVPDDDDDDDDDEDKNVTINVTVESAAKTARKRLLERRLQSKRKKAYTLISSLKECRSARQRKKILSELAKLQKECITSNNKAEKNLGHTILSVLKESINMSKRTRRNNRRLNENAWWLFEGEEEAGDDLDAELGDEEIEGDDAEADVDVDAASSALEDLGSALGLDVSVAEEGEEDEGDEDLGDEEEELDLELEEVYGEADDMDEMMREEDADEGEDKNELDEIVEINENALKRELLRMRRSRRHRRISESRRNRSTSRRRRRMFESEAKDADPHLAHGGDVIEVDEETLINALAEELGDAHSVNQNTESPEGGAEKSASSFGGGSAESLPSLQERRRRAQRRRRARLAESRRQKSVSKRVQLAERKAAAAQKELKESNLFNAKLLYVNKLMQQHDLNTKQQRAIVEALDNAKTLREAKLLYTSLTDSLRKRRSTSGSKLNESRVLSGRSSTSTRSGSAAKSNVELDRWAKLAGLNKK